MQAVKTGCGIDVGSKKLDVARRRDGKVATKEFANDDAGHSALVKWLGKGAWVCLEATGNYHLPLALALIAAGVQVMVINPRVAKHYAGSLSKRSKTDKVDAQTLLHYLEHREFVEWVPPRPEVLAVREIGRRIVELVKIGTEEKNRLHARNVSPISRLVKADTEAHIREIEKRTKTLEAHAVETIRDDEELNELFNLLEGTRGIGVRSAIQLLGEMAVLDRTMTVKQIVGHAGLDPRHHQSGTIERPTRISKVGNPRIRAILYVTAMTAIRHERGARLFYARLVSRGKKPKVALVAVMRKLLHGIWIVLQRRVAFDYDLLFASSLAAAESHSAVPAMQPEPSQDHPEGRSKAEEPHKRLDPGSAEATDRPT
jgi:transposase